MLLRHALNLPDEAASVERAVDAAIAGGARTADVAASGAASWGAASWGAASWGAASWGAVSTAGFGDRVVSLLV
jgi:hypothetical protein